MDVDDAIHRRRSVRRFDRQRPVPRDLLMRVLDAGRFAPSSCNLQTWDYVVVADAELRERLAVETRSIQLAPVAVFVVYDRELAREGQGNVQSAAASIMTMLLEAFSLGLASLWVNALGDRGVVRELLGVPDEFEVLALVCLGYPADGEPPATPERRPLEEVVHFDRFSAARALPRSPDPDDWTLDQIGRYFRRKLQSGTRFNKPDEAFVASVLNAIIDLMGGEEPTAIRLLDVLPGTGVFTEALVRRLPAASLAILESTVENHFFCDRRCGSGLEFVPFPAAAEQAILARCAPADRCAALSRESGGLPVMPQTLPRPVLAAGEFDVATILFRLEGIPRGTREVLLRETAARVRPGGMIVVAYTSRRSWHLPAYWLRRRLGRDSVEVSPVPDPNIIGPYEPLSPGVVGRLARECGLRPAGEVRLQPLPDFRALAPSLRRAGRGVRFCGRALTFLAAMLKPAEPLLKPFARIRIVCLTRQ